MNLRFGIREKVSLVVILLVFAAAWITPQLLFNKTREIVDSHELNDLRDEASLRCWEIISRLSKYREAHPRQAQLLKPEAGSPLSQQLAMIVTLRAGTDGLKTEFLASGTRVQQPPAEFIQRVRSQSGVQLSALTPLPSVADGQPTAGVWTGQRTQADGSEATLLLWSLPRNDSPRHLAFVMSGTSQQLLYVSIAGDAAAAKRSLDPALKMLDPAKASSLPWIGESTEEQVQQYPAIQKYPLPTFYFQEALVQPAFAQALLQREKAQIQRDDEWIQASILEPEKQLGHHVTGLHKGTPQIRLLCSQPGELEPTRQRIEAQYRSHYGTSYAVEWHHPIICQNAAMQLMRFFVPRDDGGREAYFLGYGVFQEELAAGLDKEMHAMFRYAFVLAAGAGLLALILGWIMVRPLLGITRTAGKVAKAVAHATEDQLQAHIGELHETLPKQRRDEVGEIARALDHLLLGVLKSTDRLRQARADLETANSELDAKVSRRTQELQTANEQLQTLTKEKDTFLASVSHELRQPLNSIFGFLQFLEFSPLDESQQKDVAKVRHAATYLLGLINDILDYQKIIVGGLTLEPETIAGAQFFAQLHDSIEVQASERHNQLVVTGTESLGVLKNDRQRLQQVLINLLTNACKFTENGTITLAARREADPDGRDRLVIDVSDTGRGMTPEQKANLFVKFKKLASREGNRSGTGLGLVISKGLCELMGGHITVESEAGRGSTFTVRVLAEIDADEEAETPAAIPVVAELPPLSRLAGMRVLVIDDDEAVRIMIERFLTQQGCEVLCASSGEEGIALARQHLPNAITLDVVMPGWSGWQTLTQLKSDPATATIPVVVTTFVDQSRQGYSLGAADYLVKPIQWDRLGQILARHAATGATVLITEDDAAMRELTRRHMEEKGWQVLEAANGEEALALLQTHTPALILLDLLMPVIDGFEFMTLLRQEPRWRDLPVIVLTGLDLSAADRARLSGSVSTILKKNQLTLDQMLQEALQNLQPPAC